LHTKQNEGKKAKHSRNNLSINPPKLSAAKSLDLLDFADFGFAAQMPSKPTTREKFSSSSTRTNLKRAPLAHRQAEIQKIRGLSTANFA
jgi:hypothetical protein